MHQPSFIVMAEWSKALELGSSLVRGGGSNPLHDTFLQIYHKLVFL